jgi:proteasome lid subunit RPN8/RPN11
LNLKIKRELLEGLFELARGAHPKEFVSGLRARDGVIYELVLIPGTQSSDSSAVFRIGMLPPDREMIGTVHSHPSPNPRPSGADFFLFERYGGVHIILAYPYDMGSWRSYNSAGEEVELEVVD